jgi:hypothetical protein
MLSQRLANPDILAIIGAHEQNQIVAGGVVRMEQVGNDAQQAEPARKEHEFIFLSQFLEDVLLEFLRPSASRQGRVGTQTHERKGQFHGGFLIAGHLGELGRGWIDVGCGTVGGG